MYQQRFGHQPPFGSSITTTTTSRSSGGGGFHHQQQEGRQDVIFRKVRGILNKITPETFDKLSRELLRVGLDSPRILEFVISLIFEKALSDPKYSSLYAKLCVELSSKAPNFERDTDSPNTFCKFLLAKCEDEFARRRKATEIFDGKNELTLEEFEQQAYAKTKMLGNIKFICELQKKGLLQEAILHTCIKGLLSNKKGRTIKSQAEDLECLCQIMKTVGNLLDTEKSKNLMDQYFDRMDAFACREELPLRIRFMLRDVIDLRNNRWRPRRFQRDDTAPKTIAKLRSESDYTLFMDETSMKNLSLHSGALNLFDDGPSFTTSADYYGLAPIFVRPPPLIPMDCEQNTGYFPSDSPENSPPITKPLQRNESSIFGGQKTSYKSSTSPNNSNVIIETQGNEMRPTKAAPGPYRPPPVVQAAASAAGTHTKSFENNRGQHISNTNGFVRPLIPRGGQSNSNERSTDWRSGPGFNPDPDQHRDREYGQVDFPHHRGGNRGDRDYFVTHQNRDHRGTHGNDHFMGPQRQGGSHPMRRPAFQGGQHNIQNDMVQDAPSRDLRDPNYQRGPPSNYAGPPPNRRIGCEGGPRSDYGPPARVPYHRTNGPPAPLGGRQPAQNDSDAPMFRDNRDHQARAGSRPIHATGRPDVYSDAPAQTPGQNNRDHHDHPTVVVKRDMACDPNGPIFSTPGVGAPNEEVLPPRFRSRNSYESPIGSGPIQNVNTVPGHAGQEPRVHEPGRFARGPPPRVGAEDGRLYSVAPHQHHDLMQPRGERLARGDYDTRDYRGERIQGRGAAPPLTVRRDYDQTDHQYGPPRSYDHQDRDDRNDRDMVNRGFERPLYGSNHHFRSGPGGPQGPPNVLTSGSYGGQRGDGEFGNRRPYVPRGDGGRSREYDRLSDQRGDRGDNSGGPLSVGVRQPRNQGIDGQHGGRAQSDTGTPSVTTSLTSRLTSHTMTDNFSLRPSHNPLLSAKNKVSSGNQRNFSGQNHSSSGASGEDGGVVGGGIGQNLPPKTLLTDRGNRAAIQPVSRFQTDATQAVPPTFSVLDVRVGGRGSDNDDVNGAPANASGAVNSQAGAAKSSAARDSYVEKTLAIAGTLFGSAAPATGGSESETLTISTAKFRELKIPKVYQSDCLSEIMKFAIVRSDLDREKLGKLINQLVPSSTFEQGSLLQAFKILFSQMEALEIETPKLKSHVAGLLSFAISNSLLSLEEVGVALDGGKHHPLFLLCLQKLEKSMGQNWLSDKFNASEIELMQMLPESDRSKERLASILRDRALNFLYPMLTIEPDLWQQMTQQGGGSPTALYRWIKENVNASLQKSRAFATVLFTCLLRYITQTAAEMKKKQAAEQDGKSGDGEQQKSPSSIVDNFEKDLLQKYQPILQMILDNKDMQLETLYALQDFYYQQNFPKGALLRWFLMLYDLGIIEDDVFLRWKEEINDQHQGKGQALFQVNNWLNWLAEPDSDEEEEQD